MTKEQKQVIIDRIVDFEMKSSGLFHLSGAWVKVSCLRMRKSDQTIHCTIKMCTGEGDPVSVFANAEYAFRCLDLDPNGDPILRFFRDCEGGGRFVDVSES
jgi:hypothetical protein